MVHGNPPQEDRSFVHPMVKTIGKINAEIRKKPDCRSVWYPHGNYIRYGIEAMEQRMPCICGSLPSFFTIENVGKLVDTSEKTQKALYDDGILIQQGRNYLPEHVPKGVLLGIAPGEASYITIKRSR